MPSFVVTLAGLLIWQGVILQVLPDVIARVYLMVILPQGYFYV